MKLFEIFKRRKRVETQPPLQEVEQKTFPFHEEEYRKALKLYDEAHTDTEYQNKLSKFYDLINKIRETYSVINSVGSFSDTAGDNLIQLCAEAITIEDDIKEKREYYEDCTFEMSEPCKTLAMIFEKREEYQRAATICVYAIQGGYTSDGTKSGMRGRLARMIKKGNLPLTDELKNILNI